MEVLTFYKKLNLVTKSLKVLKHLAKQRECCSITSQLFGSYLQCKIFKATLIYTEWEIFFKLFWVFLEIKSF